MGEEKTLNVHYTRTIRTRPITFTCAECGREVTEDLYPGRTPRYCLDCVGKVRRRQNAEAQRRWRARHHKAKEG